MKKGLFMLLFVVAIASCQSKTEKKEVEKAGDTNLSGVENVNGNIPDTTNAINVNPRKKDSTATTTNDLTK